MIIRSGCRRRRSTLIRIVSSCGQIGMSMLARPYSDAWRCAPSPIHKDDEHREQLFLRFNDYAARR